MSLRVLLTLALNYYMEGQMDGKTGEKTEKYRKRLSKQPKEPKERKEPNLAKESRG